MVWEAAKTATAYVGIAVGLTAAMWVLVWIGRGIVAGIAVCHRRWGPTTALVIAMVSTVVVAWLFLFAVVLCCGVPI